MNKKRIVIVIAVLALLMLSGALYGYFSFWGPGCEQLENRDEDVVIVTSTNGMSSITPAVTSEPTKVPEFHKMFVYVCGAVNIPGVYEMTEGSRLYEAVEAAGGLNAEADVTYYNLSQKLVDEQQFYFPTVEEMANGSTDFDAFRKSDKNEYNRSEVFPININTADSKSLTKIPGIGETRAGHIIAYRSKVGKIEDVSELRNISGFSDSLIESIREYVTC